MGYLKNDGLILTLRKYPKYPEKDMINIWTEERKQLLDIWNGIKDGKNKYTAIRSTTGMLELHILDMEHFTLAARQKLFGIPAKYHFKNYGVESGNGEDESDRLFEIDLNYVTRMINLNPRDENVPYFIGIKKYKGTDPIWDAYDSFTTAMNAPKQRAIIRAKKSFGDLKDKTQKSFGDLKDKAKQKFGDLKNKIPGIKSQLTNSEKTQLLNRK